MKNFERQGFSESSGESQLSQTPKDVNACSCDPGCMEDVVIFPVVVMDFQAASPRGRQLQGNVP